MSIFKHHEQCAQKLLRLSEFLSNVSGAAKADVDEETDRYSLWAGNVGANQFGTSHTFSLDYRLREASFYRDQVVNLLAALERHLDKAIAVQQGSFPDLDGDSESGTETSSLDLGEEEATDAVDNSNWDISDTDSDLPLNGQTSAHDATKLDSVQESSSDSVSLHGIRHIIDCLYQLPLRRPAPISRIREESEHELRCFEHFDIAHVREKFPQLAEPVAKRLGKLITRRRQLLLYRKKHQEKLQTALATANELAAAAVPVKKETKSAEKDISEPTIRPTSQKTKITIHTKATTARVEHIAEDLGRIPESRPSTSVAASESTRKVRLYIPPRPAPKTEANDSSLVIERPEFFECNYCRLLPIITSDLAWK